MTRRALLGSGAAAAVGALLARTPAWGATGPRPNILCLVSEDCAAPYLGAYGGLATTPVLDRLAADGVRWAHCFSAAPVCAPSRLAMITGLPPESCGPAEHMRAMGRLPPALNDRGWPALLREAGYYCTNNAKEDYNAPIDTAATWDASHGFAHWRNRPAGAPFFAIFNPQVTHESNVFYPTSDEPVTGGRVTTPPAPAPTTPTPTSAPRSSADPPTPRTCASRPTRRTRRPPAATARSTTT